ncbi:sulfate/molybdate ABC transporter ATP-binding protein [Sphingomonas bacterium]|uniref:sulfate/molybdate ABC transporter ATP-binding protein n=1 Tax=Sphingomonas bacterium TaxID=1895847 RepID=UPI00157584C0|nr:sulfate/molybdate ABC transporter ATP-binding protein [Sphingomonas bacterium]
MSIALKAVGKAFGTVDALRQIDLAAQPGEFLALLGPSGSGKTTLLRIMAGLEFPDTGSVHFDGEDVTRKAVADRRIGFVFQHYALFQHMTVADNVAFGLTVRRRRDRPSRTAIAARARELLDLVQLGELGTRYPSQLSGGQRQRVALARALAVDPRLLLLDEPFGALDAKVRKDLRRWLRELHERMGLTSVFVTHDQDEALELADRVVVMRMGRIEQIDRPADIYARPASAFVFDFVGEANCISLDIAGGRAILGDRTLSLPGPVPADGAADLCFRPHDVALSNDADAIPITIASIRQRGGGVRIEGEVAGQDRRVEIDMPNGDGLRQGQRIGIQPTRAFLYPR